MKPFQLFFNIWAIAWKAPAVIGVIRSIMDLVGSEYLQRLLDAFNAALKKDVPFPDAVPKTDRERWRLFDRTRRRQALEELDMTEADYNTVCQMKGISGRMDDEQLA